ncbi:hypothetical protein [Streptomyces qinglanensis]|uniref:Uncharacterized protein n=1 Tax=Streptomyces qinglanensis TaxID=943816 RepID=A0A1H9U2X5_9ACTN|nr:hypothetical protein [Streptomyces qinglanensis]SES03920.1 hypothetical protein SAMN05421870_107285 [Streptomyces qinglanensis]
MTDPTVTDIVLAFVALALAAAAVWCAVDTSRHARRAQAAHREAAGHRARAELAALKAARIRRHH